MQKNGYRDLIVWQKSIALVVAIYKLTAHFPREEIYGLTSQIKRASVSIPSNIAEGSRRRTQKDVRHFLTIAYGSASELETQIEIAKQLKLLADETFKDVDELLMEVLKMLKKMTGQG